MPIRKPVIQLFSILCLLLLAVTPLAAAPDQPTLVAPADDATGVFLTPTLSVNVSGSYPMTVKFYQRPANNQKFSIVVLPDTQNYSDDNPDVYFKAQTQWVVNNKSDLNIVYVGHVGDIVNIASDTNQYIRASAAMAYLEDPVTTGLADGIPYGVVPGNHDVPTTNYNVYFGYLRFGGRAYYGGHYGSNNDNSYTLFSAGGMDFIVVNLNTDDLSALTWANQLLITYGSRRAVVVGHNILELSSAFSPPGSQIYNALRGNANLFLILCGHNHGETRRSDTYNGNTVNSLLADYQDRANGGNGWLRIMEFDPSAGQINVKTYSPTLQQYETDTGSQFSLGYNMGTLLAINTNVASGTISTAWPAPVLNPLTGYEWFVTVSDATGTTTGPFWSFTTGPGLYGDLYAADCDVDGSDLAKLIANPALLDLTIFAQNFGRNNCL